ncbi:hypothetical protein CHISP_0921 [Chitinispirillum alkaliphilum]|nr:hypothetical protein CHISP_0921 [Chitinispirillum alkaliphilum]
MMDRKVQIPISEMAKELKRTEADIEFALRAMEFGDSEITFTPETRIVSKG